MEFLHPAMWHNHDINFASWLHPAMWHVALKSWQWIHQVAAPCNVIRGSGIACHWIRPVAAHCNVTRSSRIMIQNLPCGSTLQCGRWLWDDMPLNSPECPPYWNCTSGFDFDHHHRSRHVISFCNSLRNFIQIGPPSAEKMTLCRFSRWWISVILLNCLVFQKIAFLHFGVNIQDGGSPPSWIIGVQ